jgi:hypothetical protein
MAREKRTRGINGERIVEKGMARSEFYSLFLNLKYNNNRFTFNF